MLGAAVHSSFVPTRYPDRAAWQQRVSDSEVRLQWDPDHDPNGAPVERRAIQLGLRGTTLRAYASDPVAVTDVSAFVAAQRDRGPELLMPVERVYPVADPVVALHLGLDAA